MLGFSKGNGVVIMIKQALDLIYCINGHQLECVTNKIKKMHRSHCQEVQVKQIALKMLSFQYTHLIRPILETNSFAWNTWLKNIDALKRVRKTRKTLRKRAFVHTPRCKNIA